MMRICRTFIIFSFFLLISSPCRGDISSLRDYILYRNASGNMLADVLNENIPYKGCIQTISNLICIQTKIYPNITNNQTAKMGVLKNLLLSVRQLLYLKVLDEYAHFLFINRYIQKNIFLRSQNNTESSLLLKGVESSAFSQDNWCAAVASIKIDVARDETNNIFRKQEFADGYSKASLAIANKLISEAKYDDALAIFNELHNLKPHDINIYMCIAEALYKAKRLDEAEKIAARVLSNYSNNLTEKQLIKLNELFNNLNLSRY